MGRLGTLTSTDQRPSSKLNKSQTQEIARPRPKLFKNFLGEHAPTPLSFECLKHVLPVRTPSKSYATPPLLKKESHNQQTVIEINVSSLLKVPSPADLRMS